MSAFGGSQNFKFGDSSKSTTGDSAARPEATPAKRTNVPRTVNPRLSATKIDPLLLEHGSAGIRRRSSVLNDELALMKMSMTVAQKPPPINLSAGLAVPIQQGLSVPSTPSAIRRKSISDTSNATPATAFTAPPQQYVLEKPPRLMKMTLGDQYMIPFAVTSLRFDICFAFRQEVGALDVEIACVCCNATGKKIDHVTMIKRTSRDKSMQHLGDEKIPGGYSEYGESIVMHLAQTNPEVTSVFIALSVSSAGRFVSDFEKLHVRVVDIGLFPGNPELFRFQYQPNRIKQTGVVFFALTRESISRSPSTSTMTGKKKTSEIVHLWTAKAIGVELVQRSIKLVSLDCEDIARRLASGWLPIPKGLFQCGGDLSRIVSDRMMKKAMKKADESSAASRVTNSPSSDTDDESRESRSRLSGRDSIDTVTPVDPGELEFESLFSGGKNKSGQGRPRVVRRNKRVYSVGRAVKVAEKHRASSDEDEGSDDENDLFRQVFHDYASRRVVRYDEHCYNVGTYKEQLLQHYLEHKELYDDTVKHIGDSYSKGPLVVDCVVDEEEDLANLICPPMTLDPDEATSAQAAAVAEFNNANNLISIGDAQRAKTASPQPPEGLEHHPLPILVPERATPTPPAGGHATPSSRAFAPRPPGSPCSVHVFSAATSPASASHQVQPRFGRLKPPPPIEMQQLRQHAERKKQEEEEAMQRSMLSSANNRSSKNLRRKSRSSITADMLLRRGTGEVMKINTRPMGPRRPQDLIGRAGAPRKKSVLKSAAFSGELLGWIEAHLRKEQERKTTYGRNGRTSLSISPTDPVVALPFLDRKSSVSVTPSKVAPRAGSSPTSDIQQQQPPSSADSGHRLSGDPLLISENRRMSAHPPNSREGRRPSVQFQFPRIGQDSPSAHSVSITAHSVLPTAAEGHTPGDREDTQSPNLPEMAHAGTQRQLR